MTTIADPGLPSAHAPVHERSNCRAYLLEHTPNSISSFIASDTGQEPEFGTYIRFVRSDATYATFSSPRLAQASTRKGIYHVLFADQGVTVLPWYDRESLSLLVSQALHDDLADALDEVDEARPLGPQAAFRDFRGLRSEILSPLRQTLEDIFPFHWGSPLQLRARRSEHLALPSVHLHAGYLTFQDVMNGYTPATSVRPLMNTACMLRDATALSLTLL